MESENNVWGKLAPKYKNKKPRKILSLDGGGIRGLITARALIKLEKIIQEHSNETRLCDYFDYIGGTSTGAIIASALSIGMSAEEVLSFYKDFGKKAFKKTSIFKRFKSLYEDGELERKMKEEFGVDRTLHPKDLENLLLIVTRNATTDSAWPISSNPIAKYNDTSRDDCNLDLPLWQIVRASTAAPVYFPEEVVELKKGRRFVFVDGGTTAYNNPAFLMYRMATLPEYGLGWDVGEKNLLVVSIGTGLLPAFGKTSDDPESNLIFDAKNTLGSVMSGAAVDQDLNCRSIGRCTFGHHMDNEIGDLIPRDAAGNRVSLDADTGKQFLYARYNFEVTREGLNSLGLHDVDVDNVNQLDSVDGMDDLERIGEAIGNQINADDFGSFL